MVFPKKIHDPLKIFNRYLRFSSKTGPKINSKIYIKVKLNI